MCLSPEKESRDKLCGTPMIALPSHSGRVPVTGICTMMLDYGFHSHVHSWSVLAAGAPATTYRLYSRKIKTKASPTNKKFLPCWINGLFFLFCFVHLVWWNEHPIAWLWLAWNLLYMYVSADFKLEVPLSQPPHARTADTYHHDCCEPAGFKHPFLKFHTTV